jgi:hypothetical protein
MSQKSAKTLTSPAPLLPDCPAKADSVVHPGTDLGLPLVLGRARLGVAEEVLRRRALGRAGRSRFGVSSRVLFLPPRDALQPVLTTVARSGKPGQRVASVRPSFPIAKPRDLVPPSLLRGGAACVAHGVVGRLVGE